MTDPSLRSTLRRSAVIVHVVSCCFNVAYAFPADNSPYVAGSSSMEQYFDSVKKGAGIWKWRHYFNTYARHFERFRGTDVHFAEVGIFSGGSLQMWRWFLGPKATIYGIDISNKTRIYEANPDYGTPKKIFVGDQADPKFWEAFKREVPRLDVLIDDGGHAAFQQQATLEAIWPHLSPGGVFLTEDVEGKDHQFFKYVTRRFIDGETGMNGFNGWKSLRKRRTHPATLEQQTTAAVSFYPYVIVLDKSPRVDYTDEIRCVKRGSVWQPPKFWDGQMMG